MKGKFLFCVFALFTPMALATQAAAQVAAATTDAAPPFERYEVFAGGAYSGANQVKGSSGLTGFNIGANAKLKRWFGATADYGYYSFSSGVAKPTVSTLLAGPELSVHAENLTGFFHVMFGGAHTGGVDAKPNISFATGVGGGFEFAFAKRLSVRVAGDGILSSFVLDPDNQGYSAHLRVNPRGTVGVAYHF